VKQDKLAELEKLVLRVPLDRLEELERLVSQDSLATQAIQELLVRRGPKARLAKAVKLVVLVELALLEKQDRRE